MSIQKQPFVSVIMPAYNAGVFVMDAVESILNQTHYNLELIIVDDGSTDITYQLLEAYARRDRRIRLYRNKKNCGVSVTAKRAISKARGDYIVRMDADDISMPTRIEKQIAYLDAHTDVVAVGGQVKMINKDGVVIGEKKFPQSFEEIYRYIYSFVPMQQGTMTIARRRLPKNFVYYVDGMNTAEEVELFFKLFQCGRVENLPDYVYKYRMHDKNTSFLNLRQTFLLTLLSRIKAVYRYGYTPHLSGTIVTFFQALMILILPQRISLALYKSFRWMQTYQIQKFLSFPSSLLRSLKPAF